MKALILAAGRSTRMQPVKDKIFLNFLGKSLLQRQVKALIDSGFEDIIVVCGKHNIERSKAELAGFNVNFNFVIQENLDEGMAGAMKSSVNDFDDEALMVVSCNDVVDESAFKLMKEASTNEDCEVLLLGKKMEEYFPGGYIEIDENGFASNIVEKPGEGNEPSDLVNLVVHVFQKPKVFVEVINTVESDFDDVYEVALAEMMHNNVKIKAVEFDGFWQAIKFPWHVQEVFRYYLEKSDSKISENAVIAKNATIKGKVIIEDGVKVLENAVISGPAYIGKNSIVANNALVRDSHVGENSVVGYNCEIARSYLEKKVWTHSNYIGDSLICEDVSFGAGSVTGNLRLDEKNIDVLIKGEKQNSKKNKLGAIIGPHVRVAINVSLMPGVKIGSNSMIGAGICLGGEIAANSFVRGVYDLKVSENTCDISQIDRSKFKGKI